MDEILKRDTVVGVPLKRQEIIEILNECYALNLIELDEFEKRIIAAEQAHTIEELEKIIADIPEKYKIKQPQKQLHPDKHSINPPFIVMSTKTFSGKKLEKLYQELKGVMSTLVLDFRKTELQPGTIELNLSTVMCTIEIIVPPGFIVENYCKEIRSTIGEAKHFNQDKAANPVKIQLTGKLIMSTLYIKVKKDFLNQISNFLSKK